MMSPISAVLLPLLAVVVPALSSPLHIFNREACQYPSLHPLDGCPPGTLLVGNTTAKYGLPTFPSIQSAVLSLPQDNSTRYILILPGTYYGQINVTRPGPLYLLGQTPQPHNYSSNAVVAQYNQATGNAVNTFDNTYTSVLTVAPTLNASYTGSGPTGNPVPADTPFGSSDFRAYNIDFVNAYAPYSAGPALSISISYANAGFYSCRILSYQDTVYIGKLGNTYIANSEVAGQTDFLYGFGTLWIQSSLLSLRSCGGGVTAWKGTNTTFENKYGAYIHDSELLKANSTLNITGKCALGRPWNAGHRSIFANNYLDDSILPAGYIIWSASDPRISSNTTMAEYKDYGPGFNLTARLAGNVTKILTDAQEEPYSTPAKVFQYFHSTAFGNVGWIDKSEYPY